MSPNDYLPIPTKAILDIRSFQWSVSYSLKTRRATLVLYGISYGSIRNTIARHDYYSSMVPNKSQLVSEAEALVQMVDSCNELGIELSF